MIQKSAENVIDSSSCINCPSISPLHKEYSDGGLVLAEHLASFRYPRIRSTCSTLVCLSRDLLPGRSIS